jgi:polysaccharide biosynthesis transport protein
LCLLKKKYRFFGTEFAAYPANGAPPPLSVGFNIGKYMDFEYLLRILNRRKWLIAAVALATTAATFVLIGRKPETYKATVLLSTGIVNYKGIDADNADAFVQQYQVENAFSNLVEFAASRSTLKLLAVEMLKHDLNSPNTQGTRPYRTPNTELVKVTQAEIDSLRQLVSRINLDSIEEPSFSQHFDFLLEKVSRAYGYDHDMLQKSISVKRKGQTDLLLITVITDNPLLSQYMANTYVKRTLQFYQNKVDRELRNDVVFYTQYAAEKKVVVDNIRQRLFDYMKTQKLPAFGTQSQELVRRISEREIQRERALTQAQYARASYQQLQKYIDGRVNFNATEVRERMVDRDNTNDLAEKVRRLTEESVRTGKKDARIEAELGAAKAQLDQSLRSYAGAIGKGLPDEDERIRTREDLYKEQVKADLQSIEAEKEARQLDGELSILYSQMSSFVQNDQVMQTIKADQDRAEEDLNKVTEGLILARLKLENAKIPHKVLENAQIPEWPEPNRQVLLSVFAAIVAATMAIIAILLLAYLDNSLQSPDFFKKFTGGLPLLGAVQRVPTKRLDFQQVFAAQANEPQYTAYREALRRMRAQLLQSTDRVYLFVSTRESEGKTFMAYSLAHALAAHHKRVLIVDTNFKTPVPGSYLEQISTFNPVLNQLLENYGLQDIFRQREPKRQLQPQFAPALAGDAGDDRPDTTATVDLLGNGGIHHSPGEVMASDTFRQFIEALKTHYDFIFMESAALNQFSDAHELLPFADKVIAVFRASSTIQQPDKASLEFLQGLQKQGKLTGAILTDVEPKNG